MQVPPEAVPAASATPQRPAVPPAPQAPAGAPGPVDTPPAPQRGLNLLDSTMLIMGSMIGSGIFIVSAAIARDVQTPGLLLLAWVVSGVITVFGALSYGELSAMMPKAGGQYVYLKEAYGPLWGFLFGWTVFAVIQTGTIAAVAVAFAKFTGVVWPAVSDANVLLSVGSFRLSTQQLLAVCTILLLMVFNYRAVKDVAFVNNLFTFAKIGALVLLIGLGVWAVATGSGSWAHFATPPAVAATGADWWNAVGLAVFGAALVGSLFSSDAWNNITYTAGEVQNPRRNIPLALVLGTGSVCLLYLLANVAYLYVLPIDAIQAAEADRVGTLLMRTVIGPAGVWLMALMIMVSTFGCVNSCTVAGARVYYAMALDGLFFKPAAKLNKAGSPAASLTLQNLWAAALVFWGNYNDLLDYVMFAVLIFYVLTVAGVFVLRYRRPDAERPYRVWGYPFVPAVYAVLAASICVMILVQKQENALPGLYIVLAGVPVYYLFRWWKQRAQA